MKKIAVVTGFRGFLGVNFTQRLLDLGWQVYGIDKKTYVANETLSFLIDVNIGNAFREIAEDICTINWLPECDVIFNFAAESDVDVGNHNSKQFISSNIEGVRNLLDIVNNRLVIRADKPLFFQISTDEVYGDITEKNLLFDENATLNPSNPYSVTKASADLLIKSWARTYGLDYIIARPSNNYGPFQYPEKLIPLSCKRLTRNKKIKLHNNGTPVRTWTHVDDTVEAILTLYEKAERNKVYNISSEYEQTNYETVRKLISAYFLGTVKRNVPNFENHLDLSFERPGQDIRYAISCQPLKKLGWQPKKEFDKEILKLIKHFKDYWRW